jgi:hypothetical protein
VRTPLRACVRALSRTYEVLPEGAERDPRKIVAAIVNSVSPNKLIPQIDHTGQSCTARIAL